MKGLVLGQDKLIADWVHKQFNRYPMLINKAVGILNPITNVIEGAFMFSNYNGVNVEVSYYGPRTMTPGIVKVIALMAVNEFNAARLTVVTSKKNKRLLRGLLKLGFKLEGVQRCYYGHKDNDRNAAVRMALFRDKLDVLAKKYNEYAGRLSNIPA